MARNPDPTAAAEAELPAPRLATAWASLIYAVATLMLAYPALSGAFLLNPRSDQYKAGFAFREFAAEHLRSGKGFPQWNPYLFGGMPYIAAMHGDIFYPTFLLRMIMPTDIAMTWEFPIHLFLCGLFTFLFLRAWKFGFYSAVVGGLAYMLGGSIAAYAGPGHDGKLFVSTMLPLALLLLTRGIRDGRVSAWGGLAVTIGLGALSPHPQLFQYLLLTCGVFALYLAFADQPGYGRLGRNTAIQRLAFATGAVGLGMLISAVQYWPAVFEYKAWSPRAPGHDLATAVSYSFPIEETLNAYWPQFSGILDSYWGRNAIHFHSDYFGVIVLMLVGAAFGQTQWKSFRRVWLGIGIVAMFWAFGGYTPFFKIILTIPIFGAKYFKAPSTIIYVVAFAVSVLAAIGMERLVARRVSPRYAMVWAGFGLVFAIVMSIGGYSVLSSAAIATMRGSVPDQYIDLFTTRASANNGAAIIGVWRSFLFVAAGAGIIWAFLTHRIPGRTTAIALIAVAAVDLVSVERLYWIFSPRAAVLYASDPAIDAIKADMAKSGQISRVWTEPLSDGVQQRDPAFVGDALMSHDLRTLGNYHGNELGMYDQLTGTADVYPDPYVALYGAEFLRHENVGYLYTGANDSLVAQLAAQLKFPAAPAKLAGPVRNAAGSMVYAYKLPVPTSPAWVATGMFKAPPEQALGTILDARFDPARIAIIDTSASAIQAQPLQGLPAPSTATAKVTAATDGSYDITLDQPAAAGSALVVSENYYPGWHATADGKPASVARTNYNLIGVALPTGAKSIQLRFTDAAYEKGKTLSLVALAIAVAAWIFGWVVERRRRTTPTFAT